MLFSPSSIVFPDQCGRNCLRCSRVRNAELLLPKETTPSVWFPRMPQHYVSFCAEESSSPANKFRQGPRQPHRNWWPPECSARAPKYWGRARQLVQLRPPGQKDRWNVEDLLGKSFFWKLWDKRSRLSVETIDPMVSASPGVQAGVSDKAGVSDCLSVRHGIHSSRQKDLRADSPKVKPLRSPPLK